MGIVKLSLLEGVGGSILSLLMYVYSGNPY
jgi:hypothetical protein